MGVHKFLSAATACRLLCPFHLLLSPLPWVIVG